MKNVSILLLAILPFAILPFVAVAETVTFDSPQTIGASPSHDLTASGSWFIQLNEDRWVKNIGSDSFLLYPNKDDLVQSVLDDQAGFRSNLNTYIKEGIENGFFMAQDGTDLGSVGSLIVTACCIDEGNFCNIFVQGENGTYMLKVFEDVNDETEAATTARTNILTELANISSASDSGEFYRVR